VRSQAATLREHAGSVRSQATTLREHAESVPSQAFKLNSFIQVCNLLPDVGKRRTFRSAWRDRAPAVP